MSETFTIQEDNSITRDSDGEVMANVNPETGEITFTHQSREKNYGARIRELVAFMDLEPVDKVPGVMKDGPVDRVAKTEPREEPKTPDEAPPPHPQFGRYTDAHLLHDHVKLEDKAFNAKWGGRMHLSTKRKVEAKAKVFGVTGEKILARLAKLNG